MMIIGSRIVALTATIAAATSRPDMAVTKTHEAFTTGPCTVAVKHGALGAIDGLTALFP